MLNILLLPVSICIGVLCSSVNNHFSKKQLNGLRGGFLYSAFSAAVSACLLLLLMRPYTWPSGYTLGLGALYGTATVLSQILFLLALSRGPLSLTTMLTTSSMPITTLVCALFWKEAVSLSQWIGMSVMAFALVLCVGRQQKTGGKSANILWLLLCAGVVLLGVLVGVLQKNHQLSPYKGELDAFLVTGFLVGASLMGLSFAVVKPVQREAVFQTTAHRIVLPAAAVIYGLCSGTIHKINMYLVGVLPSVLFFPVNNGGSLLLSMVVSVTVFREKLTEKQVVAIALGIAAILLLGNVFSF